MSTTSGIQALINTGEEGKEVNILREIAVGNTTSYYCHPVRTPKARARWVDVDTTQTNATNAAAILAAMV
jgi:hypothetical protein